MPAPGPIPLQSDWIYGPVTSRRFGRSLGVNLLPIERKVCNMECVYCQYAPGDHDGEFPEPEAVFDALDAVLRRSGPLDAITIAGNGEPTLHPRFALVVAVVGRLRDELAPGTPLCLLSNGIRAQDPAVRLGLERIDRPFFKLDAASPDGFADVNRPRAGDLQALVRGLRGVPRLGLQAMFFTGRVDNTSDEALEVWLELAGSLEPSEVHLTTLERGTQTPGLRPLPAGRLEDLAARARERGLPARAFPCGDEARFHG